MTKKETRIRQITLKMTTIETVRKGECSLPAQGAVLDLLHEALQKDNPVIFVEDERSGGRYRLTKKGLVKLRTSSK
jgi:pyruvate/2-oxoglutarate/acetoin dehydrogenase E1 component